MKKEAEVLDVFEAARQAFFAGDSGVVAPSASVVTFKQVRSFRAPASPSSSKTPSAAEKEPATV